MLNKHLWKFSVWKLFWPFFGLFGLWNLKHSLGVGITSKVKESHILHGKKDVTLDFFVSSDRSVSLGSLYPLGSQLQPSLRSCVKTTLGGKGCPRKHFSLRRKKNPRWHRFSMEERDIFWRNKSENSFQLKTAIKITFHDILNTQMHHCPFYMKPSRSFFYCSKTIFWSL